MSTAPQDDPLVLEPTALVAGGDALAREPSGRVVFVRGALPGERVAVRLVDTNRDFARAEVEQLLRASADRVTPPCPYVERGCGGCDLQHAAPAAQPRLKAAIVADALRRIAHISDVEVEIGPPLPAAGFRTTMRVGVRDGRAGLHRPRSHDLVTVDHCLVAHPALDRLLTEVRFGAAAREATLRVGAATGERLVLVEPTAEGTTVPDDVRVVGSDDVRRGRRAWFHDEVEGLRFRISATSFFQSRTDGAAALVEEVRRAAGWPLPAGTTVIDAYGGVGLFASALTVGADGAVDPDVRVTLVERSRSAVADARVNLASRDAQVMSVAVERWTPHPAEVVVADPARDGLGKEGVARLTATGAERLVLVSCDAAALARDARLLLGSGYSLDRCTLVDLFPHTHHVEVVSSFRRR